MRIEYEFFGMFALNFALLYLNANMPAAEISAAGISLIGCKCVGMLS